jgi:hypothetical protein
MSRCCLPLVAAVVSVLAAGCASSLSTAIPAYPSAGQLEMDTLACEQTATGRAWDRARTVRTGWWTIRARDTTGGLTLEAWYDSLTLSRQSKVGELAPDTDGLLGGIGLADDDDAPPVLLGQPETGPSPLGLLDHLIGDSI